MSDYTYLSLSVTPGKPRQETPLHTMRNPPERKLAEKVMREVGNSRFSIPMFASYLYNSGATQEEITEMTATCVHFLGIVADEVSRDIESDNPDTINRGYMAQRVMDSLSHFNHVK